MSSFSAIYIESLIQRFKACTLPKNEWTHEAHLVVALWYTMQYDEATALTLLRKQITRYNEAVGMQNTATAGYHETITRFWLRVTKTFLRARPSAPIATHCKDFIASPIGHRDYLLTFYSNTLLYSAEARRRWVAPDLGDSDIFDE